MPALAQPGGPAVLRWGGAAAIVLALHGVAAWLLLTQAVAPSGAPAAPEAVMLELAPDLPAIQPASVAPPAPPAAAPPPQPAPPPITVPAPIQPPEPPPPTPIAPEPPSPEPPPPELPPLELPPTPPVAAEVELPVPPAPPPPKPQPQPRPKPRPPVRRVEREPPPPAAEAVERPAAPAAPAPAPVQAAPPASSRPPATASALPSSWRGDLLGRLQRAKRYPDLARSRGDQGVATVSFTMDRAGRVLSVTLVRSSGSPLLDEEATALVRRAEPLPRLPDEIAAATMTLTVPISFALR